MPGQILDQLSEYWFPHEYRDQNAVQNELPHSAQSAHYSGILLMFPTPENNDKTRR